MERKVLVVLLVAMVVLVSSVTAGVVLLNRGGADPRPDDDRTALAWVDLLSLSSGTVREQDRWGSVETFKDAPLGTLSYYKQVSLSQSAGTEAVVLDGEVWCMVRSNVTNAALLRYAPDVQRPSWNISFECYAPQGNNAFDPSYGVQRIGLTATLVDASGRALASVDLFYGTPGNNCIQVRSPDGTASVLSDRILPGNTYRGADEGQGPQRYIVSFQHVEGGAYVISVVHSSGVLVGQQAVELPALWSGPKQLVLSSTSVVTYRYGVDPNVPFSPVVYVGAWVVDNLACRGATARYPSAGPLYEYAYENGRAPGYNATRSAEQSGAAVTIGGRLASYNATTGRYEAELRLVTGWSRGVDYSVILDGVTVNDRMYVTMMSTSERAFLTDWWNGWDWVSVFGLDDCSGPGTAIGKYAGYEHPLTAYCQEAGGSSQMTLAYPYAEIALHSPHDWEFGNRKFWKDAVQQAKDGVNFLRSIYDHAGRWDAPSNGGKGDTYISMANPGNKASYQLLYALYGAGIRVDGRSSDINAGAPGNHTQLGSWYDPGGYLGTGAGWYPYRPIDLMDANRALSWDGAPSGNGSFALVDSVAQNHGVLRILGHPSRQIMIPDLLQWIDNDKANYSLENWKATDGEVASYIYGRWSTDLTLDRHRSSDDTWTFNVSRADPAAAGYWNVPITVGVDLGGRSVKDIVVSEGGKTLRMSEGTLKDLQGKRIMDLGFDLRDGKLYVSRYWNSSATLTVALEPGAPAPFVTDLASPLMMRDP